MRAYIITLALATLCVADLPIDCRFSDVVGTWEFTESHRDGDSSLSCDKVGQVVYTKLFTFEYPNLVTDEIGNTGTWTLVYNQGFEVNINERSYWAPFYYDSEGYACNALSVGFSRDATVRHWSCFTASKLGSKTAPKKQKVSVESIDLEAKYVNDHELIKKINSAQNSWKARAYPEHEQYTLREMLRRAGNSQAALPKPAPVTEEQRARAAQLPDNFDWRDVGGVNYVSPVEDQQSCGSCYTFSSAGMLEARLRIATNFSRTNIFSKQDVVSCSKISEGCDGGFSYLIAGRYAMEQGMADQSCNDYTASDSECNTDADCLRTYVSEYGYVGGYYGASNELLMMEELVKNGPIAVAFMVHDDFHSYAGGIYHHVDSVKSDFDPYFESNHAVTMVGYGIEAETGEKYWIVKNSWGRLWGEYGYFRIRRGTNEVGIETMGFAATIIP